MRVNNFGEAQGNDGYWYFTNTIVNADKQVYFTDRIEQVDLVIYYVNSISQVGWQNQLKKKLLR
ncbi:MAG TPA: hypothetical protein ENH06_00590 [bacterium]|nr:hypothetical protein [bacterium]